MAKKSRSSPDIISETQQNSRWFFGYRRYQPFTNLTPAELYRMLGRNQGKLSSIPSLIFFALWIFILMAALFYIWRETLVAAILVVVLIFMAALLISALVWSRKSRR